MPWKWKMTSIMKKARKFISEIALGKHGVAVTTDYVLDETLTLLRSKKGCPLPRPLLIR
jgi:predicted nucleic acid-binding protein